MRIILLLVLLLMPAGYASAVFYNNTETIEIGDGELPEPSPDSTDDPGTVNEGVGSGGDAGSTNNGTEGGSSNGGGDGGGSAGGGGSAVESHLTGGDGGSAMDASDVINALISGGALSGFSTGAGSAGAPAGTGGSSVRIIGERVRQVLSSDIDLREILSYWRKGSGKASDEELGLIAASTALRDTNIQEITFGGSNFEIVYRSRGYLLAVIPWSFPVRLTVIPEAPVIEERVQVKLPWYRFFVRKFFTVRGLQRDIDEMLTRTTEGMDGDSDQTTLLFEATSQFLRQRVGTVADSVLLGTQPH